MAKPIPAVEPLIRASLFSSWRFIVIAGDLRFLGSRLIPRSLSCGEELSFQNPLSLNERPAQLRQSYVL
jgi:hypothetical protein